LAENWIPETLNRLALRRATKPDTKAGQIWALWPEIKAAVDNGQSFKSRCEWLKEDAGIIISVASLRSYVSRSRRRETAMRKAEAENTFLRAATSDALPSPTNGKRPPERQKNMAPAGPTEEPDRGDPLDAAMRALTKSRRFDIRDVHGDGDPSGKNLI
jgi:hypothetical protein